ncbi:MAG: hypothetical protein ACAI38_25510 [Myxococcota bacterium]
MVAAGRAGLLLLAGLFACSPSLETPSGVRIRCVDHDDCPSERCSTTVGVCIAKDDDDSPLRIVSVEALDSRHIVVLFNRVVDPSSAGDFTVYALSPGISPEAAEVADDHLSVTVQTTQQKLRTYLVDVVDVFDPIGRPLERTQKTFTGIGEQVSALAPTPLAPLDHSLFGEPEVALTWSALDDAVDYSIEVVRLTPAGEIPIVGSPFVTRETELNLTVEADATYSWRVTADTSREPPVTSSFAVFGDAIHVYCAATADCSLADTWDAGTSVNPSRRIGRALALAAFLSRGEVRIAGRGAGGAYDEGFIVAAPITRIRGGYDPSFTVLDPAATPTIIRGDPAAVRVITTIPLELFDLELHASGGVALALTGVAQFAATRLNLLAANGGRPLDARRCTDGIVVTFSNLSTGTLDGPGFPAQSRVTGACEVDFDHAAIGGAGIEVVAAGATFLDSTIAVTTGRPTGDQDFLGLEIEAVLVQRGSVTLLRSFVRAGTDDGAERRVALRVLGGGNARVDSSTLVAARVGYGECDPVSCQGYAYAIEGRDVDGVGEVDIVVTNSVLAASSTPFTNERTASAVYWVGPGRMSLIHDILYASEGTALQVNPGQASGNDLQVLDSALVCSGTSVGGDNVSDVPPRLLRATAIVGCTTPYMRLGASYTTASAIMSISDPAPHSFSNLHVLAAPVSATFPQYAGADTIPGTADDDWSCGAACSGLGESSQNPICGSSGASTCAASVTVDSAGVNRTSPVSLGPREVD